MKDITDKGMDEKRASVHSFYETCDTIGGRE